jgi:large subunit ribosomal protein L7/L12
MADDTTKKEDKKLSKKVEELVESISKLSVIELSELVNSLQDKLGVSAQPTVAAAAPAGATPAGEGVPPAGSDAGGGNQTLIMTSSGSNKIAVIKALREINQNWTLMEAKAMTEQVPAEILKDTKAEEVKEASEKLKAAGATVEVK